MLAASTLLCKSDVYGSGEGVFLAMLFIMQRAEPLTVAFVEDDADIVEILNVVLQHMGCLAAACPPVPSVAQHIIALQPHLVILDVRMGQVDGVDIFRQLREDPTTRDVPVIFFTATEQRVAARLPHYREMGASFVIKPNIAQLSDQIERMIGGSLTTDR